MSERVLLLALGTRGDVEPFARLGHELAARGTTVTAVVLADGADRMRAARVRPVVVGPPSARAMWSPSPVLRAVGHTSPGLLYVSLRRRLAGLADAVAAAVVRHAPSVELVLSGLPTASLVPVLVARGVPARLVLLAPLMPHPGGTSAWGGPGTGWHLLPRAAEARRQALMWGLTLGLSASAARATKGRGPTRGPGPGRGIQPEGTAPLPGLLATSRALDPDPAPGLPQTGWWRDPSPVRPLGRVAERWCVAHPDAVLLALGSLPVGDPHDRAHRLAQVAHRAGRPAVVQLAGAEPSARGGTLVLGEADHRALLPRVAAVVHHGGSGTTHAAAAAGRPQVLVPHLGDQQHYARQVHRLGLGPAPLPAGRATGRALTARLRAALDDHGHATAATSAAAVMAAEDGLAVALGELGWAP